MSLKTSHKESSVKIESIPARGKAPRREELNRILAVLKKASRSAVCHEYQKRRFAYSEAQSFKSTASLFEIPVEVLLRDKKVYFTLSK